jgi:hypothetical protein
MGTIFGAGFTAELLRVERGQLDLRSKGILRTQYSVRSWQKTEPFIVFSGDLCSGARH